MTVGALASSGRHRGVTLQSPAFFVSPTGNDANAGTISSPFLTTGHAQTAMRNSSTTKTTYLRGGTYTLAAIWNFTASDNGTSWLGYPGETPVISGSSQTYYINVSGVTGITFMGLTFDSLFGDINGFSGAPGFGVISTSNMTFRWNTLRNVNPGVLMFLSSVSNSIFDSNIFHDQAPGNFNGTANAYAAFFVTNNAGPGSSGNTFSHNEFYNIAAGGIAFTVSTGGGNTANSNNTVDRNYFHQCCTNVVDMGSIYFIDRLTTGTGNKITNNKIFNTGNGDAGKGVKGIYLDETASNTTVTGNVLYGGIGAVQIFHSHLAATVNNVVQYNIFAITTPTVNSNPVNYFTAEVPAYQDGGSGNNFSHNILYFYTACHNPIWSNFGVSATVPPTVTNNLYYSANGSTIFNNSPFIDSAPVGISSVVNPQFTNVSTGDFSMPANGPAFTQLGWTSQVATDQGPVPRSGLIGRTNYVQNPRAEGSTNGTIGSGGAMPTYWGWSAGSSGLVCAVTGTGTENGIPYLEVNITRVAGTATSIGVIYLELFNSTPTGTTCAGLIAQNAVVSCSAYFKLQAGDFTNVTALRFDLEERSASSYVGDIGGGTPLTNPTGAALDTQLQKSENVTVSGVGTTQLVYYVSITPTATTAINFTLRIGAPDLEVASTVYGNPILPPVGSPTGQNQGTSI